MPYRDYRDYLAQLDRQGLIYRVRSQVCKDTELMPMVRWQFRGLPADQRKAFFFEDVTDARGRSFAGGVAVATLAASREVYAAAAGCTLGEIASRWSRALTAPLPPRLISTGPVKEVIIRADDLHRTGGVDAFPHPISTPGFDPAPYLTSPFWITRDPEDGTYNVGTYRGMIKGPDRIGCSLDVPTQHLAIHLAKARRLGRPLPAAIVVGALPALGLTSAARLPYALDELAVAGALNGEPLDVVKCETADLWVPAAAEMVIEGEIDPTAEEPEAPFGETTGYMGARHWAPVFKVKCITHRQNPIYQAFISQFPPSESTLLRKIGFENVWLNYLQVRCNIPSVRRVSFFEAGSTNLVFVIQLERPAPGQAWQALNAAVAFDASLGKVLIAVDEDIDPEDPEALIWALSYRMQPHRDVRITRGKLPRLDPSAAPPGEELGPAELREGTSALLINATRPWAYPPASLPGKEYMERARRRWEQEGLPELTAVKQPWHGYELGFWPAELQQEAALAALGRYLETGAKLAGRNRPVAD